MKSNELEKIIKEALEIKETCLYNSMKYEQGHYENGRTLEQDDESSYCTECKGELKELCDIFFRLTKETFATFR